jgi:hypothetical protein
MSLAVPTWIAAIAAVILAVGAIITAIFAIRVFGRQSRQLQAQERVNEKLAEMLPLQAEELRDALSARKRAQAAQIFIEVDRIPSAAPGPAGPGQQQPGPASWRLMATVRNTSRQPIYDLHVIWQQGMVRMGKPDRAGRLMPDSDVSFERLGSLDASPPVDPGMLGAFLAFRDAAGVRWAVREDGTLTDTSAPSQDTLGAAGLGQVGCRAPVPSSGGQLAHDRG